MKHCGSFTCVDTMCSDGCCCSCVECDPLHSLQKGFHVVLDKGAWTITCKVCNKSWRMEQDKENPSRVHGGNILYLLNHAAEHEQKVRTATGRIASSAPNIQNIPVRTEAGKQVRDALLKAERLKSDFQPEGVPIKRVYAFRPK